MKGKYAIASITALTFLVAAVSLAAMRCLHGRVVYKAGDDVIHVCFFHNVAVLGSVGNVWEGVDLKNGRQLWATKGSNSLPTSIGQNSKLMLISGQDTLIAVDVRNGTSQALWHPDIRPVDIRYSDDDLVLVKCADGMLYAFSTKRKDAIWKIKDESFLTLTRAGDSFVATYISPQELLQGKDHRAKMVIINGANGITKPLELHFDGFATSLIRPLRGSGCRNLYYEVVDKDHEGWLYCVSSKDFSVRWRAPGGVLEAAPLPEKLNSAVLNGLERVREIDTLTGEVRWTVPFQIPNGSDYVAGGEDRTLFIADGRVLAISSLEGTMYVIQLSSGKVLEKVNISPASGNPYYEDGFYYWYDGVKNRIMSKRAAP